MAKLSIILLNEKYFIGIVGNTFFQEGILLIIRYLIH